MRPPADLVHAQRSRRPSLAAQRVPELHLVALEARSNPLETCEGVDDLHTVNKDAARASITISPAPQEGSYEVAVNARSATRHCVTISSDYLRELGLEALSASKVLHEAFVFLLQREPNTSILASFDLRDIERYFPDFRREITQRLRT
jgi:hypothetical protein